MTEHRAQSTEHRAQSTEHRAQSTEHRAHLLASGFTLIELSIVLVVISLIIMGIIGGTNMLRASAISGTISQINQYKTFVNIYTLKYDALPGDHSDAWDYYDGGNGGNVVCGANSFGESGCNGNGDGQIRVLYAEDTKTWVHLSLAGMMPFDVSAAGPNFAQARKIGVKLPKAKINGAGVYSTSSGSSGSTLSINYFQVGAQAGYYPNGAVFTPAEAISIDKKIDDGKCGYGKVVVENGSGLTSCRTGYNCNLNIEEVSCVINFQYSSY